MCLSPKLFFFPLSQKSETFEPRYLGKETFEPRYLGKEKKHFKYTFTTQP